MDDDEPMDIEETESNNGSSGKIGSKRSSTNTTIGTPKKRPVTDQSPSKSKPLCKYGDKCYQKSIKHHEMFSHSSVSNRAPVYMYIIIHIEQ